LVLGVSCTFGVIHHVFPFLKSEDIVAVLLLNIL
jgi:hypothetical protein